MLQVPRRHREWTSALPGRVFQQSRVWQLRARKIRCGLLALPDAKSWRFCPPDASSKYSKGSHLRIIRGDIDPPGPWFPRLFARHTAAADIKQVFSTRTGRCVPAAGMTLPGQTRPVAFRAGQGWHPARQTGSVRLPPPPVRRRGIGHGLPPVSEPGCAAS